MWVYLSAAVCSWLEHLTWEHNQWSCIVADWCSHPKMPLESLVQNPAECVSSALSRWFRQKFFFFFFFTFAWQLPKFGFDVAAKRIMLHWSGFSPPVPTMSWQFWAEHLAKQSAMPLFCHTVNNQAPDAKRPKLRVFFYPVSCSLIKRKKAFCMISYRAYIPDSSLTD